MKRDMDVIRQIVLTSMERDEPIRSIEGVDPHVFGFQTQLLEEAGLAKCLIHESSSGPYPTVDLAIVWRLTWDGFEFAQSIQDPTVWERVRDNLIKPAGSWTFGLLIKAAEMEVKRRAAELGFPID